MWLTLFAIAMANVEAALVVHLRSIYYPDNPLVIFPINLMSHRDFAIELGREFATIVMLLGVAMITTRGLVPVFAAFVYTFGLWDIFYYAWLKLMIGWPSSWLEWDVLFLIPWPWFGPWLAPVLIALLFVIWGGWMLAVADKGPQARLSRATSALFIGGTIAALAAFLLPAIPLLSDGREAFQGFRPHSFSWSLFTVGYVLMALGLWRTARNAGTKRR